MISPATGEVLILGQIVAEIPFGSRRLIVSASKRRDVSNVRRPAGPRRRVHLHVQRRRAGDGKQSSVVWTFGPGALRQFARALQAAAEHLGIDLDERGAP